MARRGASVCPEPGCPNFQPCEKHRREPWAGSDRRGSTRRGRAKRARILARDPICVLCGTNPSSVCDHVVQVAHGAPERYEDTPDELLQGICKDCDRIKSAREGAAGRRGVGGDH